MTRFTAGPAAGITLDLARHPLYLRVAEKPDGTFDALDQLEDAPDPGETLHAYRRLHAGNAHLDVVDGRGRRSGRWEKMVTYEPVDEQPAQAVMCDNDLWRAWCRRQPGGAAPGGHDPMVCGIDAPGTETSCPGCQNEKGQS